MSFKDNYTVVEELGSGGMATVSKAVQRSLDRLVAVKRILPKLLEVPGVIERFEREAKASASLNHINIMDVVDFSRDDDGSYCIVMEYIDGPTLSDILEQQARLPLDIILSLMIQALGGLEHAHNNGILHRDMKPDNIMISRDGVLKITDFGVSQVAAMPSLTVAGQLFGSPSYMSPEQAMGKQVDSRSDLFACGTLLYELLTGTLPFEADNMVGTLQKICYSEPKLIDAGLGIPEELMDILYKALEKDATDRYFDAAEFMYALESFAVEARIMVSPRVLKAYMVEHYKAETPKAAKSQSSQIRQMRPKTSGLDKERPSVSFLPLQGCFGCQVNLLDLHEELAKVHNIVDVQFSYLMDTKDYPKVDIGFVEGSVANEENRQRLLQFREKCEILVALGTCACFGGIPGMRNLYHTEEVISRAYRESESLVSNHVLPDTDEVPALTDGVMTVANVVEVDFIIPGCPSPHELVLASIANLINGDELPIPSHNLCHTCSRTHDEMLKPKREFISDEVRALMELEDINDSRCFLEQGVLCMGMATREGCSNRCVSNNTPCTGCMGPPPRVRETGAKWVDALGSLLPGGSIRFRHDLVGLGYRYSMPISMIPKRTKGDK